MEKDKMTISAIDFDGTIVKNKYPFIGETIPFAIETIKLMQKNNYKIILWTCRHGKELSDAINFLSENGIYPNAVNENVDETKFMLSRKIYADEYIDDRSVPTIDMSLFWNKRYNELLNKE